MDILIYGRQTATRVKSTRLAIISMLQYLGISEYYNVKTVLGNILNETNWLDNTKLIIMPGVYNDGEHLEEDMIKNVHRFIGSGGSYLAMCAGAYTSCSYNTYKSSDMKIDGHGKINIFPGHGRGSVYHPVCFSSTVSSRMIPLSYKGSVNKRKGDLYALYNGGPEFLIDNEFSNFETLATYTDYPTKKAIVRSELGKGRILLSGVYPILNIEYMEKSEFSKKQLAAMERYRGDQQKLWIIFLKYLLNVNDVIYMPNKSRDSYDT